MPTTSGGFGLLDAESLYNAAAVDQVNNDLFLVIQSADAD
jgi:hypothetical protein